MRRGDLAGLIDDPLGLGVDHRHGVVLDALELRLPTRAHAEGEDRDRDRRRQHTREGTDDERSAVERPTGTCNCFDELLFLAGVRSRRLAGPERRKRRGQPFDIELVDVLGMIEVLEPELAEIPLLHAGQLVVGKHRRRSLRSQDLAAVAGRHDARGTVDAEPVIPLLRDHGLTRVQPHPYAQLRIFGPGVGL